MLCYYKLGLNVAMGSVACAESTREGSRARPYPEQAVRELFFFFWIS